MSLTIGEKYLRRLALPHPVPPDATDELDRLCLACHQFVPYSQGLYVAHIRAVLHHTGCADVLRPLERVKSSSRRGRWRPVREVFALVNGARCPECQRLRGAASGPAVVEPPAVEVQ